MPEQVRHDEKQMPDLSRILSAKQPLTLSGTPAGFLPWLLADLARAADKRAIFIAADEVDMRAVAATAAWFAPELDVFSYPAWDCLPYDRASPTLRVMAARPAALHRPQQPAGAPQHMVTTANAVGPRPLPPFCIRTLGATPAPGDRIGRDRTADRARAQA